jgi:Zn-dependent peptidase ImmA (M78 family)/transcriptional regulator with XRE-family HTH domain
MDTESFGQYARRLRLFNKLGLREAARLMGLSAAYLSQVEKDDVPGSPRLMAAMARVYRHPLADIQSVAQQAGIAPRVPSAAKQSMEELRSLYRVGGMFTAEEVESMIRHALRSRGVSDDDIDAELARLRADLPRVRKGGDALFAAEIKPRFLSKKAISDTAYRVLEKNGFGQATYQPPTPIELLVDSEDGVSYLIAPLPSTKNGDPVVLGRSRWNGGLREITINTDLADSDKECDLHRFRFTLAHELFHAIEHLQLPSAGGHLHRAVTSEIEFVDRAMPYRRSAAERAVNRWVNTERSHGLSTAEDWREWQSNCFASAILIPEWGLKKAFAERFDAECIFYQPGENAREIALRTASEIFVEKTFYARSISQTFGVSRQAMAIRLLELGLIREVNG